MARILLLTSDAELADIASRVCKRDAWELTVRWQKPRPDDEPETFDLVMFDVRPAPTSDFTFLDVAGMMLENSIPVRAARVMTLAHYEPLVGRMNTLVHGGCVYMRIHPFGEAAGPHFGQELRATLQDALTLPEYDRVDFHDAFPDREFYRHTFESIQVPIVLLTMDAHIKLMNLRALALFDYVTQMVIDQEWSLLIAPSDRGRRAEELLMRINSAYFYEGTLRFIDRRQNEFPALITSSRVFSSASPGGTLIVLTIVDLTEVEALQRQLTTFQRMESVERVVAGLTHEFNNMLTAILGHAELLTEDLPEDSDVQESAQIIHREAMRAQNLTGRLLGLSSSRQFVPGPLSCREIVEDVVTLMRHTLGDRIRIETQLLEESDTIEGEASQLHQMLVNLCLNARDAIEDEGIITIRTSVKEITPEECRLHQDWTPGIFVELAVSDTGCGIARDALERIFEPFYTTKADGAGTGLGLSVVRGMARTHGGHVGVESELNRGTTVMVRLPQSTALPPAPAVLSDVPEPVPLQTESKCVLVVDDDHAVLTFAHKVLQRAGYGVYLASNGAFALAQFDRLRDVIDVVILDMTMPGQTGRQVLDELRERDEVIPVILCTAFAPGGLDNELVDRVQGFLKKPFRPRELVEQVNEVLELAEEQESE